MGNIITQHFGIWSRRKPGATMQSLTQARTLCQALLSLCAATGDRDEKKMVAYLKIALHNKSWDKILRSIRHFKGATADEVKLTVDHRFQFKAHLVAFFHSVVALYQVHLISPDEAAMLPTVENFLHQAVEGMNKVDLEEDLEGEQAADPNPLVG